MEKAALRKKIITQLKSFTQAERDDWSKKIHKHLNALPQWQNAKNVCAFVSLPQEVNTHEIINECSQTKELYVPFLKNETLTPVQFLGWENMKKNEWDILEPIEAQAIEPEQLDIILVPSIALNQSGQRLGRGKGFYDRFLKESDATKIAIAFHIQIVKDVPTDKWDVPVDIIVTERGIVWNRR